MTSAGVPLSPTKIMFVLDLTSGERDASTRPISVSMASIIASK